MERRKLQTKDSKGLDRDGVGCHFLLRDVFYTFKQIKKTMNIVTEMLNIKLYHALGGGGYMTLYM